VSRFSIPAQAGREKVAPYPELARQAADQLAGIGPDGDELRDGPPPLGDHEPLGIDAIEDRKTLLLELGGGNRLHASILANGQLT
jgi:hypothetical protein